MLKNNKKAQRPSNDLTYNIAIDYIDKYDILHDSETLKNIKRYEYCMRFNIAPFPGSYDSQPKEWLDFIREYDQCDMIVKNYSRVMNKNGR